MMETYDFWNHEDSRNNLCQIRNYSSGEDLGPQLKLACWLGGIFYVRL